MKKIILAACCLLIACVNMKAADYVPQNYVWTSQSRNSSESMPCGGGSIGMNVWVENGDVLFYLSRSGMFDENNTLLKAGRFRLRIEDKDITKFSQRLSLNDGAMYITLNDATIKLWADVFSPNVFMTISSKQKINATLSYESWRYKDRPLTKAECQQSSWKWDVKPDCMTFADSIKPGRNAISFYHQNRKETVVDYTIEKEKLSAVKSSIYNPIGGLKFGGTMTAPDFTFRNATDGKYASTDFRAWNYAAKGIKNATVKITLHDNFTDTAKDKQNVNAATSAKRSAKWWHNYWQRSYIIAKDKNSEAAHIARNWELFRYILGCNAYSKWPTKFNGGLFTFDPEYVDAKMPFTPDYRRWGGGTMTAQNQRLVYWPMLKSGDTDMMEAQFDTYLRMLPSAIARTKYYWNHGGACFTEQLENCGLPNPAEYGSHKKTSNYGVMDNAWLEYLWDTSLEFCSMILYAHEYTGMDIKKYEPLIENCLTFFDEHYQYVARQNGKKALTEDGKLILYPGSAAETYKMAYNASSTVAALKAVLKQWEEYGKDTSMALRIPEIPFRVLASGDSVISPAVVWTRCQNEETPQLYPVFPWRIYGLGREGLNIARNTYSKDPLALKMRSAKGWKQDNIWAACLGLTDEAKQLCIEKFKDGPYRFPAFWEPGFDWAPDCNRGGSAMIGLEEMLLQEKPDGEIMLFPAWPKEWKVKFRMNASKGRVINAEN
ncbi:MAG: DUF5703 domain-containing protein [Prevotella sp.]|nr:DUF5703 domain-containing protein [Prevotella sp.]